ncbi:hypothetical protein KI387_005720, partial [Taxus chinensis]
MIDDEEVDNLDVSQIEGAHEVMDSTDEKACTYHVTMKIKKLNIGTKDNPKEAIIGDY